MYQLVIHAFMPLIAMSWRPEDTGRPYISSEDRNKWFGTSEWQYGAPVQGKQPWIRRKVVSGAYYERLRRSPFRNDSCHYDIGMILLLVTWDWSNTDVQLPTDVRPEFWLYSFGTNSWRQPRINLLGSSTVPYEMVALCDSFVAVIGRRFPHPQEYQEYQVLEDLWVFDGNTETGLTDSWIKTSSSQLNITINQMTFLAVQESYSNCSCKDSALLLAGGNWKTLWKLKCIRDGSKYLWQRIETSSHTYPQTGQPLTAVPSADKRFVFAISDDSMWQYVVKTEQWKCLGDFQSQLGELRFSFLNISYYDDHLSLYVMHVAGLKPQVSKVCSFNPDSAIWSVEPAIMSPAFAVYTITFGKFRKYFRSHYRLTCLLGFDYQGHQHLFELKSTVNGSVWAWNRIVGPRWSPTARENPTIASNKGSLYVLGGKEEFLNEMTSLTPLKVHSTELWKLDVQTMGWALLDVDSQKEQTTAPIRSAVTSVFIHDQILLVLYLPESTSTFSVREGQRVSAWGYNTIGNVWMEYQIVGNVPSDYGVTKSTLVAINDSTLIMIAAIPGSCNVWFANVRYPEDTSVYFTPVTSTIHGSEMQSLWYRHLGPVARINDTLIVFGGYFNMPILCIVDIWHLKMSKWIWTASNFHVQGRVSRNMLLSAKKGCFTSATAVGPQVFVTFAKLLLRNKTQEYYSHQLWLYLPQSQILTIVSDIPAGSSFAVAALYHYGYLILYTPTRPQLVFSNITCPAGYASDDLATFACQPCQLGSYTTGHGEKSCHRCPNGLLTANESSTDVFSCNICVPNYCHYGSCFVLGEMRPLCQCMSGFSGDRCQFPTYYLIALGVIVFIAMTSLVICVPLKMRQKRRNREQLMKEHVEQLNSVWQISSGEVTLMDRVGSGGYGEVYRAEYRESPVAVKILRSPADEEIEYEFQRETKFMQTIRHPNIVMFIGAGRMEPDDTPFIVAEFMHGGSVRELLDDASRYLTTQRKIEISLDVAKGMDFLHSLSPPRIHRDLKSDNLLLSSKGTTKIADFGLGRQIRCDHLNLIGARRQRLSHRPGGNDFLSLSLLQPDVEENPNWFGAARWRAPEVSSQNTVKCDTAIDVYSFGIVLWEVWTRQIPFCHYSFSYEVVNAVRQGERPPIPNDCIPNFATLMSECWQHDPSGRPKFLQILNILSNM